MDDGRTRCWWSSASSATPDPLMVAYHDDEWGRPCHDDDALFERLVLETFQAGLSWATILRKRPAFREAFHDFDPDVVAGYGERDVERLLADPGIVRNRRKIDAAITNACATVALRADGGLAELVWSFRPAETPAPRTLEEIPAKSPESTALSKALRRKGFAFVGPTTMFALMEAIGMIDTHLVGSHRRGSSGIWPAAP